MTQINEVDKIAGIQRQVPLRLPSTNLPKSSVNNAILRKFTKENTFKIGKGPDSMPAPVKNDILAVLDSLIQHIRANDSLKIKDLSNHTIHNASIYQDEDSVSIAVLIYALSKITERETQDRDKQAKDRNKQAQDRDKQAQDRDKPANQASTYPQSRAFSIIIDLLVLAKNALQQNSLSEYRRVIEKIFKAVSSEDSRMKLFVEEVTRQARIKKGMKLYDHGISAERSAHVLGVSQWELMNYLGKTQVSEAGSTLDVDERLRTAKKIFNVR